MNERRANNGFGDDDAPDTDAVAANGLLNRRYFLQRGALAATALGGGLAASGSAGATSPTATPTGVSRRTCRAHAGPRRAVVDAIRRHPLNLTPISADAGAHQEPGSS